MPFNAQQGTSSFPHAVVLAVLLIVSLVLFVVYGQEGEDGALHKAQSGVMGVTGQVAGASAGLGAATSGASSSLEDATANPTTLSGLRDQNDELRSLLAEAEEYRQENERLRGLLDMKQVSGATGPVARVIGRSTNAWDQSITIDIGSAEGVTSGMTVMGSSGVIGQVSRAFEKTATVRLLTDPNSGAAVMVQSSRANGIVRGSLNGLLYLEDFDEDQLPVEGDVILTSGLGGSYERGLIVGAVASVGDTSAGAMPTIVVNPNASAVMLEEVIVVFKASQSTQAGSTNSSSNSSASSARTSEQSQASSGDAESASDEEALDEEYGEVSDEDAEAVSDEAYSDSQDADYDESYDEGYDAGQDDGTDEGVDDGSYEEVQEAE